MPKTSPTASWSIQRIGGLMDGVFAIAMTLLVFNLKVPVIPEGAPAGALGRELWNQLPQFPSFGPRASRCWGPQVAYTILFQPSEAERTGSSPTG